MAASRLRHLIAQKLDDQLAYAETLSGEISKFEHHGAMRARDFLDEWARLTQATIGYSLELNGHGRRLTLEAARKLVSVIKPADRAQ